MPTVFRQAAGSRGGVGGRGGLNNFEAAVNYTYNGSTYYVPGGTDEFYENKDHVVRIFKSLAWVDSVDADGDPTNGFQPVLQVMAVDHTYTAATNADPCP